MAQRIEAVGIVPAPARNAGRLSQLASMAARKPLAAFALLFLVLLLAAGLLAPWLSPGDPYAPSRDRLEAPSAGHVLGTDELGRDVMTRAMWGARTSMTTGLSVSLIATAIGLIVGGLSGFIGGTLDTIVQRLVEAVQALPALIIAMVLVKMVGPVVWNNVPITVVIALSVVLIPSASRVARSSAMTVSVQPYVEAARSMGGSDLRIFFRHVVPNILSPMLVIATAQLGAVILAEASLSFLGIGTPPPIPSWGAMVSGTARSYLQEAPWLALVPGLAITISVLAFNFLGDGIRDLADPRLRQAR